MRIAGALASSSFSAALLVLVLGCEQMGQGGDGTGAGADAVDGGAGSDAAAVVGGGCGVEQSTGLELCVATTQCPNVVVDTQAMPSCGFRIRGSVVDLVCACAGAICPMGVFSTCAEAEELLASQTEQGVCVQVAEGRCAESIGAPTTSSSSGGNPACDRQCVKDCGGGAACASVCNCD